MKKIMFLGGSNQQTPAIKYAKDRGYYTILCDYLSDNPGQYISDEFYCISTTDEEKVLEISKKLNIDGIVAYASDPAAPTAAYVAQNLNLPSNPYESVLILSKKDKFREFLKENGFNCPKSKSFDNINDAKIELKEFNLPIIIKPTDSSGSKGVSKVEYESEFDKAFDLALSYSREKKVIVEEFIERKHPYVIGGDCFIVGGKIVYKGYLNSHRNSEINPYVPIGTSYPLIIERDKLNMIDNEIQRVVDLLNLKIGALNIEMIFDENDNLHIIEIGPRNGGNMIPDLLKITTGIDLIEATVECSIGNKNFDFDLKCADKVYSTYVLHSNKKGILDRIIYNDEIKDHIIKCIMYKEIGDTVDVFDGSNKAIGIIFIEDRDIEFLHYKINNMNEFINIEVIG